MAYTEADVETDAAGLQGTISNSGYVEQLQDMDYEALARLKAAALEGAKVQGLELQLEASTNQLRRADAKVLGLEHQVATLTAEREAVRNQLDRVHGYLRSIARNLNITEALSGPEFEVAAQEISTRLKTAESERDALRAQAQAVDEALSEAVQEVAGHDDEAARNLRLALGKILPIPLSDLPAETTPATAKRSCNQHADCDAADKDGRYWGVIRRHE